MARLYMGFAISLLALGSIPLFSTDAEACSCTPPDLVETYNNATDVLRVRVLRERRYNGLFYYRARVHTTYKGCAAPGEVVTLSTPVSSATCGQRLDVGGDYLITSYAPAPSVIGLSRVLPFNICGFNRPFDTLEREQIEFLDTRFNCCGDTCACVNSPLVHCFVDPCSVATCPEGECVANYCGGCNAEFYNEYGQAVCTACESDDDCAWGQHCSRDGQCLGDCDSDDDCAAGNWCRPTQAPEVSECVPFQSEGEQCGGFTPIWSQLRCAPDLVCADVPPNIPDLPGVCRRPCHDNTDCRNDQYCDISGLCREDGACKLEVDCGLEGNDYGHIRCVGHGLCGADDACGWTCGDPRCLDLAGVDFGPCDAVLGWAVVDDACRSISGCDSRGFTLFRTAAECRNAFRTLTPVKLEAADIRRVR